MINPVTLQKINQALLSSSYDYITEWIPGGEVKGAEYIVCNPNRADSSAGSFKINLESGVWAEFATEDKGANLFSLYQYIFQVDEKEALKRLKPLTHVTKSISKPRVKLSKVEKKEAEPISPGTEEAKILPPQHSLEGQEITHFWGYCDEGGKLLFWVLRYMNEEGKKETIPCRYLPSNQRYDYSLPPGKRVLFNLPSIKPGVSVIFSEGEKTATHLAQLYPHSVSTTSVGGASNLFKSNLSPLEQVKEILVFPDNDEPGHTYAIHLAIWAWIKDVPVKILNLKAFNWREGEDSADYPDLRAQDYEENLIPFEEYFELMHQEDRAEHVIRVLAQLDELSYQFCRRKVAKKLGVKSDFLDDKVQKNRPGSELIEQQEEPELTQEEKEEIRKELYPEIAHIAESKNIFETLFKTAEELGVVGEKQLVKATFCTLSSRFLSKPVSMIAKGVSSSGKSSITQEIIKLFPEEAYIILSGGSAKSLVYGTEDLNHRILVILEANLINKSSDNDDPYAMFLRTLLSEQKIIYEVVEKNEISGQFEARCIKREGVIGLLITTTQDKIHEENETRLLSIQVDESREQTKRIVEAVTLKYATGDIDESREHIYEPWRKFHLWLSLGAHSVTIPFLPKLTSKIEKLPVRFRRDIHQLARLIQTSAIIHQANRDIDGKGQILAIPEDYFFIKDVISNTLEIAHDETRNIRGLTVLKLVYKKLKEIQAETNKPIQQISHEFSSNTLGKDLGIPKTTIKKMLYQLIELNLLRNHQLIRNKPYKLALGKDFHESMLQDSYSSILPNEESLAPFLVEPHK
jgi:hypothetical protein